MEAPSLRGILKTHSFIVSVKRILIDIINVILKHTLSQNYNMVISVDTALLS